MVIRSQIIVQGKDSSLLVSQQAIPPCAIYRVVIQSPRQVVCLPPLLRLPTGLPTTASFLPFPPVAMQDDKTINFEPCDMTESIREKKTPYRFHTSSSRSM